MEDSGIHKDDLIEDCGIHISNYMKNVMKN